MHREVFLCPPRAEINQKNVSERVRLFVLYMKNSSYSKYCSQHIFSQLFDPNSILKNFGVKKRAVFSTFRKYRFCLSRYVNKLIHTKTLQYFEYYCRELQNNFFEQDNEKIIRINIDTCPLCRRGFCGRFRAPHHQRRNLFGFDLRFRI